MNLSLPHPVSDRSTRWRGHKSYWIAQGLYWFGQAFAEMLTSLMLPSRVTAQAWSCLYGAVIGIAVTHLVRAVVLARSWGVITLPCLLLRMSLASLLPALLYAALLLPLMLKFNPWEIEPGEERYTTIGLCFWSWFNMITWLALYFAFLYFVNYQQAATEREHLNASLKDAELRALKSQLNPHFLFNALNSMRALVTHDPVQARESITTLARLLRTTLHMSEHPTHSLNDEMEAVSAYLSLEHLRFEDRLRIRLDLDPALGHVHVPPLAVQSLVENALKHGIAPAEEGGDVSVSSQTEGTNVLIRVSNSGTLSKGRQSASGVGLVNLRERLRLLFGEAATLTLREEKGRVIAELRLPGP